MNLKRNEPCPECGRYENRAVTADAIIISDGKVLLIKRGTEPFKGFWATPGGHIDWDETIEEAIKREVKEETNLEVRKLTFLRIDSSPQRHPKQAINAVYLAETKGEAKAGDDATEIKWWPVKELPDPMAFDHKQNIKDALNYL